MVGADGLDIKVKYIGGSHDYLPDGPHAQNGERVAPDLPTDHMVFVDPSVFEPLFYRRSTNEMWKRIVPFENPHSSEDSRRAWDVVTSDERYEVFEGEFFSRLENLMRRGNTRTTPRLAQRKLERLRRFAHRFEREIYDLGFLTTDQQDRFGEFARRYNRLLDEGRNSSFSQTYSPEYVENFDLYFDLKRTIQKKGRSGHSAFLAAVLYESMTQGGLISITSLYHTFSNILGKDCDPKDFEEIAERHKVAFPNVRSLVVPHGISRRNQALNEFDLSLDAHFHQ